MMMAGNETTLKSISTPVQQVTGNQIPNGLSAPSATLELVANNLNSDNVKLQLKGLELFKKRLTLNSHLPIDIVVKTGVVPKCVKLLKVADLQYKAATVLHLFADDGEEQTQLVVNAGAVLPLYDLLQSTDISVVQAATQVLGDIEIHGLCPVGIVMANRIVTALVDLVDPDKSVKFQKIVARTLAILCDNYGTKLYRKVAQLCTLALINLLQIAEGQAFTDTCSTLDQLMASSKFILDYAAEQVIQSEGVLPRLMQLLNEGNDFKAEQSLRIMQHLVNSSKARTQIFLAGDLLSRLAFLLTSFDSDIVCRAACTVKNIATPGFSQTQALISAGFVQLLVDVVNGGNVDARKHAVYALGSIAFESEEDPTSYFIDAKAIPAMCKMFPCKDVEAAVTAHDTLYTLFVAADNFGRFEDVEVEFKSCRGLESINALKVFDSKEIKIKAPKFIKTFFSGLSIIFNPDIKDNERTF